MADMAGRTCTMERHIGGRVFLRSRAPVKTIHWTFSAGHMPPIFAHHLAHFTAKKDWLF